MSATTISSKVTQTVTLGSANYPGPLSVSNTGTISPAGVDVVAGVYVPVGAARGTIFNSGEITADAGTIITISSGLTNGAKGGAGVLLAAGNPSASLINAGVIMGGTGGDPGYSSDYGGASGGIGVSVGSLASFANTSSGKVTGGTGETAWAYGGSGGVGVYLAYGAAAFNNYGKISGGAGASGGLLAAGWGGIGLISNDKETTNFGDIAGGNAGGGGSDGGSGGGPGIVVNNGNFINKGTITGGNGVGGLGRGGYGGTGAGVSQSVTFLNEGLILAGSVGGSGPFDPFGYVGGTGVAMSANSTVTNLGTIEASGGGGAIGDNSTGGHGGTGVTLGGHGTGDMLINAGLIEGGAGGRGGLRNDHGYSYAAAGAAVSFGSFAAALVLEPGSVLDGGISGFAAGDSIELENFVAASDFYLSGTGLILISNSHAFEALDFDGTLTAADFTLTNDGTNTTITTNVACFAGGTRILTEAGEICVENLRIGDVVATLHDGLQPVKWIGMRSYAAPFCNNARTLPIRIAAGAIAPGVPRRDLYVSPGHALCIDGQLIHAGRLVNGVSITQLPRADSVTYFHIELCSHAIILAEGCPAESFMDEDFRAQFQNAPDYARRYPGSLAPAEPCLPVLRDGFELFAIQRRLARRAGVLRPLHSTGPLRGCIDESTTRLRGWAQDVLAPEHPVTLIIMADGVYAGQIIANMFREDLLKAGLGSGHHAFDVSCPPGQVTLHRAGDGMRLGMQAAA